MKIPLTTDVICSIVDYQAGNVHCMRVSVGLCGGRAKFVFHQRQQAWGKCVIFGTETELNWSATRKPQNYTGERNHGLTGNRETGTLPGRDMQEAFDRLFWDALYTRTVPMISYWIDAENCLSKLAHRNNKKVGGQALTI